MTTAIVAILALFTLVLVALLFFGGAYIYQRGVARTSPLPPIVERVVNPPAKPGKSVEPTPPAICPYCAKPPTSLKLTADKRGWECKACGRIAPIPRDHVGV